MKTAERINAVNAGIFHRDGTLTEEAAAAVAELVNSVIRGRGWVAFNSDAQLTYLRINYREGSKNGEERCATVAQIHKATLQIDVGVFGADQRVPFSSAASQDGYRRVGGGVRSDGLRDDGLRRGQPTRLTTDKEKVTLADVYASRVEQAAGLPYPDDDATEH